MGFVRVALAAGLALCAGTLLRWCLQPTLVGGTIFADGFE